MGGHRRGLRVFLLLGYFAADFKAREGYKLGPFTLAPSLPGLSILHCTGLKQELEQCGETAKNEPFLPRKLSTVMLQWMFRAAVLRVIASLSLQKIPF